MNRRPYDEQTSGTVLDAIRDVGRDLGTLSSVSVFLGILSVVLSLVLLVLVPDSRIFSYILLGLGLVLLITSLIVSRRRLAESVSGRQGRYGANTILMILAFVAIVAILNFVAFDNPGRLDVTSTKQFTLAPRTVEILNNLEEDVRAVAFFDRNNLDQEESLEVVENMLHEFDVRSDRFSYEIVNLDVEPTRARDYGVNQHGQVAFEGVDSGAVEVVLGALFIPGNPIADEADQYIANPLLEQNFVTPMLLVTGEEDRSVYFLVGHGERNPSTQTEEGYLVAAEALRAEGYDIRALDLQTTTLAPRQTGEDEDEPVDENAVSPTLIVVAGPQKNLLPDEEEALSQYMKDGGRMLLLLDPETPESFREFLQRWGLTLGKGNIIDQQDFIGEHRTPFISQHNPNYPFTQVLGRTFFPGVASLEPSFERLPPEVYGENDPPNDQDCIGQWAIGGIQGLLLCYDVATFTWNEQPFPLVSPEALAITSSGSWVIDDPTRTEPNEDEDRAGPFVPLAYVNTYGPIGEELVQTEDVPDRGSFIVVGDSDFATNEHFNSADNAGLFLNSANYLVGDVSLINIRPKLVPQRELIATPNEFNVIRYTSWFLLPILMAFGGILVWWVRR